MNITRRAHPARLRSIILAAILAAAGLFVTASQLAPAEATTVHAATAAPSPPSCSSTAPGPTPPAGTASSGCCRLTATPSDAPPDPLSGLASDSATLADFLKTITGPIISGRALLRRNGHHQRRHRQPERQSPGLHRRLHPRPGRHRLRAHRRPARLLPGLRQRLHRRALPGAPTGDFDAYLKVGPDAPYPGFAQCFANGLPASQAALLAATQRPIASAPDQPPPACPPGRPSRPGR